jgi:hypothetical protein
MVDRNDSFLREVDEDVRRDQLLGIWNRYGTLIVALVVVLFAGVIGYQWWKSSRIASQERAGVAFEAAMRLASEGKTAEALKAFTEISTTSSGGYQSLARMRVAKAHASAGRTAEALAAYEALAGDSAADEIMRDFAALQAAVLRLDQADWTEMKNRLTPLVDDKRPWHGPAREVLGLAAFKSGELQEATKLFEQILGDRASTSGLNRRAQEMLGLLTDAAAAKGAGGTAGGGKPAAGGQGTAAGGK